MRLIEKNYGLRARFQREPAFMTATTVVESGNHDKRSIYPRNPGALMMMLASKKRLTLEIARHPRNRPGWSVRVGSWGARRGFDRYNGWLTADGGLATDPQYLSLDEMQDALATFVKDYTPAGGE